MVAGPEIVRAPLVVKFPTSSGYVEGSNTALMLTGVGLAADEGGTEPIVKMAITHSAIAAENNLLCRIISILFCYGELICSFMTFVLVVTVVLREIRCEVMRKRL